MGVIGNFAKDLAVSGVKMAGNYVLEGATSYIPGKHCHGHDSTSNTERQTAQLLESNYKKAAHDFASTGTKRPRNKRIAVCIGCNYPHDKKASLVGCVNDATRWAELLSRNFDFECILMTDAALTKRGGWKDPMVPTIDNVSRMLSGITKHMEKGDCLVVTFSGHGTRVRDNDGDEDDGYDECLVLPDQRKGTALLTDDAIYRNFVVNIPSGAKLTSIFDCCRSGGAMDLDYELYTKRTRDGKVSIGNWHSGQRNKYQCRAEATLITGCTSSQSSLEVSGAGGRSGALSLEMIKLLSRRPYGWTYADLLATTITNVFNNPSVRKHGDPQCPTLSSSIPFDVFERRFGPCQLTGIQVPDSRTKLNSRKTAASKPPKEAIGIPKAIFGLFAK